MISEFIWLDLIEKSQGRVVFSCSLPDPDPYTEENMIVCGNVVYKKNINGDYATISVKIFDNFKELCVGDIYQRNDFVQTIIFILQNEYEIDIGKNDIVTLCDCWGEYSGRLSGIDTIIRGVD